MAEVNTVTASYNRKVQLEQFEPIQHSVELEITLEDGDDPDEVYDEYVAVVEDMVERAIAARVTETKINADDNDD